MTMTVISCSVQRYFVREAQGVLILSEEIILAAKPAEIKRILQQVEDSEGKEKPKIEYEMGEMVKVNDGAFMNLVGKIEEIDPMKVSSKYPFPFLGVIRQDELEYWQVREQKKQKLCLKSHRRNPFTTSRWRR